MTTRALLLDDEEFRFLTNLLDVLTDSSSNTEPYGRTGKLLRACERALPAEMGLQSASTENLLAEVARRMQGPRESETEPSPAPAVPPLESTSAPAPESPESQEQRRILSMHRDCTSTKCLFEDNPAVARECPYCVVIDLTAREVTASYRAELAGIKDEKGWAEMDPEALAKKVATLRDLLANGIPADIPITCTPDVLALYGVDLDEMEAACRMPTRVEVRPESVDKRYAVLAFFRGDLQAIIGFRFPKHPGCMAIYLGSMLEADEHRVERTGGGGSRTGTRGQNSLPTTPKQLINRLKGSGCSVELDPAHTDGITYVVIFRGENLGLIKSERQPRTQVTNDYNRFLRKMQAIARREEAAV